MEATPRDVQATQASLASANRKGPNHRMAGPREARARARRSQDSPRSPKKITQAVILVSKKVKLPSTKSARTASWTQTTRVSTTRVALTITEEVVKATGTALHHL